MTLRVMETERDAMVASPLQDESTAWTRIATVYARHVTGERVEQADFERIARENPAPTPPNMLRVAGFKMLRSQAEELVPSAWPAIAEMQDGQYALVYSQIGGELLVFNPYGNGAPERVSLEVFSHFFNGVLFHIAPEHSEFPRMAGLSRVVPEWLHPSLQSFASVLPTVLIGTLVANILSVGIALFALQVYDRVIPHQTFSTLGVLTTGVLLAIVLESILKRARAQLVEVAGRRMDEEIMSVVIERVLKRPLKGTGMSSSGVVDAVRNFASVREFVSVGFLTLVIDLPFVLVFLALVFLVGGGSLTLVLFVGGIGILLPGFLTRFRVAALNEEIRKTSASSATDLIDAAYQLEPLRATGADSRLSRKWLELEKLQAHRFSEVKKVASNASMTAQAIQQMTYVAAVFCGTLLVFSGDITVGTIIAVSILTNRMLMPLVQVSTLMSRWSSARDAMAGLSALIEASDTHSEQSGRIRRPRLKGDYTLRNVGVSYGDARALDINGLRIRSGQVVALVGENGSGKSTLLSLLSGFVPPNDGQVSLDNVDMTQISRDDLERGICYIPQSHRLFHGTLRQNLCYREAGHDDETLFDALRFAGLANLVSNDPKGLDREISDGGGGLSVGQAQCVAWAQAFLRDPKVLLMDEPTSAMAPDLERHLMSNLSDWFRGRTVVVATHRLPILSLCDRVVVLHQGRVVLDGPVDEVVAQLKKRGEDG